MNEVIRNLEPDGASVYSGVEEDPELSNESMLDKVKKTQTDS